MTVFLDPFSGSGCSFRAAQSLGWDAIAIDINPECANLLSLSPNTDVSQAENSIFIGDCLDVLSQMQEVRGPFLNVIYADPPFGRNSADRQFGIDWRSLPPDESFLVETGLNKRHDLKNEDRGYLSWLNARVQILHKLLTPDGLFFLHCDHGSDYLIRNYILEPIFGTENFRNHLSWKRTDKVKGTGRKLGSSTDTIFIYSRTPNTRMILPRVPLTPEQLDRDYRLIESETGRRFNHGGMLLPGDSPRRLFFRDRNLEIVAPRGKRFRWSQQTYDQRYSDNPLCIFWNGQGSPRMKIYADEHQGVPLGDIWTDIPSVQASNASYPTQKPCALLFRLLSMYHSNQEDH